MYRYRVIILRYGRKAQFAVTDHREIIAAMKAKNARQTDKLIRKHITRGKELIKKKIRMQEPRI
jgi:DNA-binding GntR family transcriptional regulator